MTLHCSGTASTFSLLLPRPGSTAPTNVVPMLSTGTALAIGLLDPSGVVVPLDVQRVGVHPLPIIEDDGDGKQYVLST